MRYAGAMKRMLSIALIAAAALFVAVPPARAEYKVRSLDFDIWCTEEARLPYERCEQRLPEDVQKFEAYRAIIEKFEIEHLRAKDRKLHFDRYILRNDPVERTKAPVPDTPDPADGKDQ